MSETALSTGPFYHGTRAAMAMGDLLVAGRQSNFRAGMTSSWIYFSATLEAATWGAELAAGDGPGRIYIVEPTGPFVDDPNLTDKKFLGNPTQSFRSQQPLRIIGEVQGWVGHPPEQLQAMRDGIARMKAQGGGDIID